MFHSQSHFIIIKFDFCTHILIFLQYFRTIIQKLYALRNCSGLLHLSSGMTTFLQCLKETLSNLMIQQVLSQNKTLGPEPPRLHSGMSVSTISLTQWPNAYQYQTFHNKGFTFPAFPNKLFFSPTLLPPLSCPILFTSRIVPASSALTSFSNSHSPLELMTLGGSLSLILCTVYGFINHFYKLNTGPGKNEYAK